MLKDLLRTADLTPHDVYHVLDLAAHYKRHPHRQKTLLSGETVVLYFNKPSTRTRISFETAVARLGAVPIGVGPNDLQLGRGETIEDTARVMSRYSKAFVIRTFKDEDVQRFAAAATIPVINALTDLSHPCQAMADFQTLREHKGALSNLKLAYVGDGNNVCHSLMLAAARGGTQMAVGTPAGYEPNPDMVRWAREDGRDTGFTLTLTNSAEEAVAGADAVYTDVWASMGQESEKEKRAKIFAPYQVNARLMAHAKKDALFMHCLPAHRGDEVTDEVIDSPNSVVYDEAENRLHAQKAILLALMGEKG